jgi:release factor glutamine methyltransferase
MTVRERQAQAQRSIAQSLGLPETEARIEAKALLCRALGDVSRAWLIAHEQGALQPVQAEQFQTLLKRRLAGEPVAYILGHREFYGLDFTVTPDVLIPRPDTELLVELALERIPSKASCRVLDLGTGSGAIAISIASQRPQAQMTAVDSCNAALAVARTNAEKLQTPNVRLLQSDWFAALEGETFDVIVSNPPYIAADDVHLKQGDLRFEPASALTAGQDGLDSIRQIISAAPRFLNTSGWLLLEHGYDQAEQVADLLRAGSFTQVESRPDLAGVLRGTLGRWFG